MHKHLRYTICQTCHGTGFVEVSDLGYFDDAFGNYVPEDLELPCEACQGEGKMWFCIHCQSSLIVDLEGEYCLCHKQLSRAA